jgi:hypothetical protein
MTTALLIGGPHDGEILELDSPRPEVRLLSKPPALPRFAALDDDHLAVMPEQLIYERTKVVAFNRVFVVYVLLGLPGKSRDALAAKHLLSPLALALTV